MKRPFWALKVLIGSFLLLSLVSWRPTSTTAARAPSLERDSLYHSTRPAMGTTFELYMYTSSRKRFDRLFQAAFTEVKRIEGLLSTYDSTSELSRINAQADRAPIRTDPEVFRLLQEARSASRRTSGAFDVTVGRLIEAWGFFRNQGRMPTEEERRRAREQAGWENVRLDSTARTVHFSGEPIKFDLGAVGKGYALDRVATLLRRQGSGSALLGLGTSTFYAVGAPPNKMGWAVHVPSPFSEEGALTTTQLRNEALSTSGSYEQFFTLDGKAYSHIIDPRTGRPVKARVQTTVVAPRATETDILSTALFVLGAEDGRALVNGRGQTRAVLVEGGQKPRRVIPIDWDASITTELSVAATDQ